MDLNNFFEKYRSYMSWVFAVGLILLILFSTSNWQNHYTIRAVFNLMAVILVGIATVGRLWCSLYISGYKTHTLITLGPYSISRNPLYFFSLLGAVGVGLGTKTLTVPGIIAIAFALYYPMVIKSEESYLNEIHGEDFARYCEKTPCFFPAVSLLQEPSEYKVKPRIFRRNLLDAIWFVWALGILEMVRVFQHWDGFPIFLNLY